MELSYAEHITKGFECLQFKEITDGQFEYRLPLVDICRRCTNQTKAEHRPCRGEWLTETNQFKTRIKKWSRTELIHIKFWWVKYHETQPSGNVICVNWHHWAACKHCENWHFVRFYRYRFYLIQSCGRMDTRISGMFKRNKFPKKSHLLGLGIRKCRLRKDKIFI